MPTPTPKYRPYYYPFGSSLNTRSFSAGNGFRFGFNTQEKDVEIIGEGNSYSFRFRIYNSSLCRFLSVDPLSKNYPWHSTYAFAENDVIRNIDLEGAEKYDYKLSISKQGKIEMKLVKTTDIIEKVIIGYMINVGGYFSDPIYETRINQRQEYTINNRNASLNTVQELQGTKIPDPIITEGMNKITSDYASNGGQFSDNYNVVFGKFMFEQGFKNMNGCAEADFEKSATETWNTINNETWTHGATLFHLYESFVRKNNNTGYDKLLHFTASAYYTINYGAGTSSFLGNMKEFWKDEVPSWMPGSKDKGWDNNDTKANKDGIDYGQTVNKSCDEQTGEFCK